MKTILKIFAGLLILFVCITAFLLIKYPFIAPWYRNKYPPEKYAIATQTIGNEICSGNQASCVLERFNKLYPFWLGTRWNFNGTSQIPGEGKIACGYFVTTIVRDMHCRVDRVRMAQCASEEMIQSLVDEKHIQRFNAAENDLMFDQIRKNKDALYIVGLDNHTGFILKQGKEISFIHSSGRFPYCVMKQEATSSRVLLSSHYKVLGSLSESGKLEFSD